jgi:hypothetical protein
MFAVQHQPVETGQAQHFGADRVCQRGPAANLNLVRRESRFKFIREDIVIHRIYLFNSAAYISIILFIQTPRQHYIYYSDVFWRYKIVIQYKTQSTTAHCFNAQALRYILIKIFAYAQGAGR